VDNAFKVGKGMQMFPNNFGSSFQPGRPHWANFRPLGGCSLLGSCYKMTKISKIFGPLFSTVKRNQLKPSVDFAEWQRKPISKDK
jgi:hypothetical protein